MARSEPTIRGLVEADADAGFVLSAEAGWNQTVADWKLMIRFDNAFGIAGPDGRLVATAIAVPYPPDFGWVSMVLVHEPFRRRGLGSRLLGRAIEALRDRGLTPVLDATPAGQPVYERSGFRTIERLTRWRGKGGAGASVAASVDLAAIAALDTEAFGANRAAVLADIVGRPGTLGLGAPDGQGFALARVGRTAMHVGPVVSRDRRAGIELLEAALAALNGPVVLDVPDRETAIGELLAARGFQAERPFARMALARDEPFGHPAAIRVICSPELG